MQKHHELQHKNSEELLKIIENLGNAIESNENLIESQAKQIQSLKTYINALEELNRALRNSRYGARSERFTDNPFQGRLFDEADEPNSVEEIESAETEITVPEHKRKKRGRKPLDPAIPRVQVIHDLTDEEKACPCGCQLTHIKDEITEQLDIIPAKMQVIQHIQKKYACRSCEETIKLAAKPASILPKSIATPGTLAFVLTQKYDFHMPLYRQQRMFNGLGIELPRATLSHWVIKTAQALQPLVNLLQDGILEYDVAYADETPVQVLREPDKIAQSKSYLWCYGGGPPERFAYVYHYQPNRQHHHAIDFFAGYSGFLHCDGYQAYDALSKDNDDVTLVGCWYHARRKFVDAAKVSKKSAFADWVIKQIQRLSKIEKMLAQSVLTHSEKKAYRHEHASPILQKIKVRLDENVGKVSPQITLGKAISYTLKQWPKLENYRLDGRLEISNNRMERAIKPFAVGKKNWLFNNSVAGAKAAAIIYSLIQTCHAHKVNPYDWLRHAISEIPNAHCVDEFERLLPFNFQG